MVVAYPNRGEGNDPEPFFWGGGGVGGVGSLSQPRLNIFTVGNMRVMICLGQGGLRSLSASSLYYVSLCEYYCMCAGDCVCMRVCMRMCVCTFILSL